LLAAPDIDAALPVAAERIASALQLPSAALRRGVAPDQPGRLSLPVVHDGSRLGTLVVPAAIDPGNLARLNERLLPGLEALLAVAIDREALLRGTVETEALRRSDELKTALLRTVSHDLRTPITAIRAAAEALTSPTIGEDDRADLREAIIDDSDRLAGLVDNLLDLSRLRTGTAEPSADWTSIAEVIEAAIDDLDMNAPGVVLILRPDRPSDKPIRPARMSQNGSAPMRDEARRIYRSTRSLAKPRSE
jgi:two-component system sensor histidine kinase KdpD